MMIPNDLPALNFKYLSTFRMVYELNNFTQAADILFLSQSTVSNQIIQLEKVLGIKLFIRTNHHEVRPTEAGNYFYNYVLHLSDGWKEAHSALKHSIDKVNMQCIFDSSHTFAATILPTMILELYKEFPTVEPTISMHNSEEVLEHVEQHLADFGFIEKPLSSKEVDRYIIRQDHLVLAGDMRCDTWLLRERKSGIYYYNEMYLNENDIQPNKFIHVQNNDILLKLLKNGLGTAIISDLSIEEDIAYKRLSEQYTRNLYLIVRKNIRQELRPLVKWIKDWNI